MMKENQAILLNYLEKALGRSKRTARNNYAFMCPNGCHPTKPKLEINLDTHQYQCWICGGQKGGIQGKSILHLMKHIKVSKKLIEEIKPYCSEKFTPENKTISEISLPKEYKSLYPFPEDIIGRHALSYLKKRGITEYDIVKYNIGYCEYGKYANRIILPTYDKNGDLNYFIARTFDENNPIKYQNPEIPKDIIPDEYLINWNLPIILCEGKFDQMAIKRNCIPLLGKSIQLSLMKKILESKVGKIYIALDLDAKKKAIQFCEMLLAEGKEVYLVELENKDPSEMGFEAFTLLIQKTQPITYGDLLKYKLK